MPDRFSIFGEPRGRRVDAVVPKCYEETLVAGAAVYVVNHNIGTQRVLVCVYLAGAPFTEVAPVIDHTSNDSITVTFGGVTGVDHECVVLGLPTR